MSIVDVFVIQHMFDTFERENTRKHKVHSPTAQASCPEYKWQNPRTIFSLYKLPADVSNRRMVCICLYSTRASSLVTVPFVDGPHSRLCNLNGYLFWRWCRFSTQRHNVYFHACVRRTEKSRDEEEKNKNENKKNYYETEWCWMNDENFNRMSYGNGNASVKYIYRCRNLRP